MKQQYHHFDFSERSAIENGLRNRLKLHNIAQLLNRPTKTIKREILRNRTRPDLQQKNHCRQWRNDCRLSTTCGKSHLCAECDGSVQACRYCERCNDVCDAFQPVTCERRDHTLGCCNQCSQHQTCKLHRWQYKAQKAQRLADQRLSESRIGLTLTCEQVQALSDLVSPGLLRGQSLHALVVANRDELLCSERTLYKLVAKGLFRAKNLDMPLLVRRRPRRKTVEHKVDKGCRIGRTYRDFLIWQEQQGGVKEVQMDTVIGQSGVHQVLLTLYWTNANFLLIFLLPRCTAGAVTDVFAMLQQRLGKKRFQWLFPAILTDRGSEFSHPAAIEAHDGETWTRVFYCDANAPQQKGAIEQEHTLIRRVLPKGTCFDHLNQEHISLLNSHIVSYPRPGLADKTPYVMFEYLQKEDPLSLFGLKLIEPKNILLKPHLLPKNTDTPLPERKRH